MSFLEAKHGRCGRKVGIRWRRLGIGWMERVGLREEGGKCGRDE